MGTPTRSTATDVSVDDDAIADVYNQIKYGVAFSSARDIKDYFREHRNVNIPLSRVRRVLQRERGYSRHVRNNEPHIRDSVRAIAPLFRCQVDLIDYTREPLRGQRYVLVMVDCFSRAIFIQTMPRKTAEHTTKGFQ